MHARPLQQYHTHTDLPTTTLEQFLRAIGNAVSQAVVLILPQIKLSHYSQLTT